MGTKNIGLSVILILSVACCLVFFQNCGNVNLSKNDSGSTAEISSPAPAAPAPSPLPTPLPLPAPAPAAVIAAPTPCVPNVNNNGIYGNFQVQCLANPETSIVNDINQAISSGDISKQLKNYATSNLDPAGGPYPRATAGSTAGTCAYMGALNPTAVGGGFIVYPLIHNEGWAYYAIKTGASGQRFMIDGELAQATYSNYFPERIGGDGPWYLTVTDSPCNFDYSLIGTACSSVASGAPSLGLTLSVGAGNGCVIQPEKIYYVNIRRENACYRPTPGAPCDVTARGVAPPAASGALYNTFSLRTRQF